jgi:DNA-binding response OmpR family regulator
MDAYVAKPIRQEELYATIESALSQNSMAELDIEGAVPSQLLG